MLLYKMFPQLKVIAQETKMFYFPFYEAIYFYYI